MLGRAVAARLPAVVEALYDSIADGARWTATLQSVCGLLDARMAIVGVVDTTSNAARFAVAWGEDTLVAPLIASYGADVPFYAAIPSMEIDVPYTVDDLYLLQGEGARQTWLSSAIARQWVMPNRLDDFFWVSLMKKPTRVGTVVVICDRDRRPIDSGDRALMSALAPHLRRAVTIGDLFEAERRTASIFRSVIETFAHPVLIVGSGLKILFANQAAEDLLAAGTLASSVAGRLVFTYAPARDALANAIALGVKDELALGPAGINVPLVRVKTPAVAHVMPLARRDPSARFIDGAEAALFIGLAGQGPLPAMEAIAALFGFTAAETRVASRIGEGLTRQEIAAATGLSPTTVQTQLAAIFDKTGVGDQRALQALIRDLTPPARPPKPR